MSPTKPRKPSLSGEVAIKFLPRQIDANVEERQRFKIEAQATSTVNHPNIATIHDIKEVNDELFIVLEYIDGRELRERIDKNLIAPTRSYEVRIVSHIWLACLYLASGCWESAKRELTVLESIDPVSALEYRAVLKHLHHQHKFIS